MQSHIQRAGRSFPVLLLTGPRQVGKTTLLRHLAEEERRYRDRQKYEIDFVLEVNQQLYPIEAKLGATVRPDWVRPQYCSLKPI